MGLRGERWRACLAAVVLAALCHPSHAWPLLVSNTGNVSIHAHTDLNLYPTGSQVNIGKPGGDGSALVFSEAIPGGALRMRDAEGADKDGRDLSLAVGAATGAGAAGSLLVYTSSPAGAATSTSVQPRELALSLSRTDAVFATSLACSGGASLAAEDAVLGGVTDALKVKHLVKGSGVGNDGIGVAIALQLEDLGGGVDTAGRITSKYTSAAAGAEVATMAFEVQVGASSATPLLLEASGAAVAGTLSVSGATSFSGALSGASLAATGAATVGGTLGVTGAATLSSTLTVAGTATLSGAAAVSGTLVVTGAATFAAGVQAAAAAVTASGGGAAVPAGTSYVDVTSSSSMAIISLPSPVVGNVVKLYVGANGYKLQSSDPTTVAINPAAAGTGVGVGSSVGADTLVECTCVSGAAWVCIGHSKAGGYAPTALAEAA